MDPNRSISRTNVTDVLGLRKEVDGGLTVEKDQILVDETTGGRCSPLGKDGRNGWGGSMLCKAHSSMGTGTVEIGRLDLFSE